MEINTTPTNNLSFKSRCVEIRDAQWVCHAITETFPHQSVSKFKPIATRQLTKALPFLNQDKYYPRTSADLCALVEGLALTKETYNRLNWKQKLKHKFITNVLHPKKDRKVFKIMEHFRNKVAEFGLIRSSIQMAGKDAGSNEIFDSIILLGKFQKGNCLEEASAAEAILRLNGVENARRAKLMEGNHRIDHEVCVFNRDGSPFEEITPNTIIVDPWVGKADFAKEMFRYYKHTQREAFDVAENTNLHLELENHIPLDEETLTYLGETFPTLIFHSPHRKFLGQYK